MMRPRSGNACGIFAIVGLAVLGSACAGDDADQTLIGASTGPWMIFQNPYPGPTPPATTPNPLTNVTGQVQVFALAGGTKTRTVLSLSGLPPDRDFGVHIHKLPCDNAKAGPHYQHIEYPPGGSPTDNNYANNMNEIWLDFRSTPQGTGSQVWVSEFRIVSERAKGVILHDQVSSNAPGMGGTAGARLACLNLQVN
jgi:Cu-Zn family superoxide dismutase